tara:strand:+ start:48 stop:503 length:456 start_codon:yes stop_codon:yes gene_type:complete
VASVTWYAYLIILFLPLLVNTAVGIYIQLYLKLINRQEKNPPWSYKKSLISAILIGAPMGALTQVLLQEALTPYVYLTEESAWNLVIFAAVFSPWLIMIGYKTILWYCKKKNYEMLYEYFRVRHARIEYPDEDSDFTIQHYRHQNHDIKEE